MNAITPNLPEAAQEAGVGRSREGVDLLYAPGERIFALSAPMILDQGWSVWPQEREGRRMPSRIDDKALSWGAYQERHATPEEVKVWCKQASQANVACALGAASGHTFAVDIDCLDEAVSRRVQALAFEHLGETPLVRIGRAPKAALIYRYDELGSPRSRSVSLQGHDDCALEILGAGRAITLHGLHHVTGRWFQWPEANPMTSPPEVAPEVGSMQVDRFIDAVRSEFPFKASATPAFSGGADLGTVSTDGIIIPVTKVDTKLADGREAFLTKLAFNVVRRNGAMLLAAHEEGAVETAMAQVTAAVITEFEANCELSGVWLHGGLSREAAAKVGRTVHKLVAGEIKPWIERGAKKPKETVESLAERAGKPIVEVRVGELGATVDAVEEVLSAADVGLYKRGGMLVRVTDDEVMTGSGPVNARVIKEAGLHWLSDLISRHVAFCRYDAKRDGMASCDAPKDVVHALLERGNWRFPLLSAVINAPTIRRDGSLLSTPGYDAATGLILEIADGEDYAIPERPTRADGEAGLAVFEEVMGGFPFTTPESKSAAFAGKLTASVRRCLPGAPVFGYTATTPGTGKTKQADMDSIIATGKRAAVIDLGDDKTEGEKRVHCKLLTGAPVIAIDNLERPIGGGLFNAMMTAETMAVRILGKSEDPTVPTNFLITVTGNNLTLLDDMNRRTLLITLDAGMERPESRRFDFDPVKVMLADRPRFVRAALTILRAYAVSGEKAALDPLGNFEEWSERVAGALVWLGLPDPALTQEQARKNDPVAALQRSVLTQWSKVVGDARISVKDIIGKATVRPMGEDFQHAELREALIVAAGESGAISSKRMGRYLSGLEGRIQGGLKLSRAGIKDGIQLWKVEGGVHAEDIEQPAPRKESKGITAQDIERATQELLRSAQWRSSLPHALSPQDLETKARTDAVLRLAGALTV